MVVVAGVDAGVAGGDCGFSARLDARGRGATGAASTGSATAAAELLRRRGARPDDSECGASAPVGTLAAAEAVAAAPVFVDFGAGGSEVAGADAVLVRFGVGGSGGAGGVERPDRFGTGI